MPGEMLVINHVCLGMGTYLLAIDRCRDGLILKVAQPCRDREAPARLTALGGTRLRGVFGTACFVKVESQHEVAIMRANLHLIVS
jgi:hypothetical protein